MMRVNHSSEVGSVDRTLLVDSLASSSNEIRLFACEQRDFQWKVWGCCVLYILSRGDVSL